MNKTIWLKYIGIATLIAYTSVILVSWVYNDAIRGDTYFRLGEPNPYIKYPEWGLGIIGILTGFVVLAEYLREEKI